MKTFFVSRTCWQLTQLTSVLLLGLASAGVCAAPAGYQIIWEDNFDGTQLDTSKWKVETYFRHAAQNAAEAISINDGVLSLTTYTENGKHYTGFINTRGKFEAGFGYFEARIRFHTTPGQWGAFWMQSSTMGNPIGNPARAGTEIDIVEHRACDNKGKDISNMYVMNLHWDGYKKDHKSAGGKAQAPSSAQPLQDNWHTYALLWTSESYKFYLDGVEQWSSTNGVSHRSEHIRLTCEVENKGWAGSIPEGGFGSRAESKTKMDVDWVRVWQRKEK